jgi:hypothetical protein
VTEEMVYIEMTIKGFTLQVVENTIDVRGCID